MSAVTQDAPASPVTDARHDAITAVLLLHWDTALGCTCGHTTTGTYTPSDHAGHVAGALVRAGLVHRTAAGAATGQ